MPGAGRPRHGIAQVRPFAGRPRTRGHRETRVRGTRKPLRRVAGRCRWWRRRGATSATEAWSMPSSRSARVRCGHVRDEIGRGERRGRDHDAPRRERGAVVQRDDGRADRWNRGRASNTRLPSRTSSAGIAMKRPSTSRAIPPYGVGEDRGVRRKRRRLTLSRQERIRLGSPLRAATSSCGNDRGKAEPVACRRR